MTLKKLETLWFNTGTLCNITCEGCYIESSPRNDRLAYLTLADARPFLDEAAAHHRGLREIGLTGGEPFMNPEIIALIESGLARGLNLLVLTNAMKPLERKRAALLALHKRYPGLLSLRVSLDHYTESGHEAVRGAGSWVPALAGLSWLSANGFALSVAARLPHGEPEADLRAGFARLFAAQGIALNADDPARLVIFPEMDASQDVPEITTACWGILGKRPDSVMCATSRMVVKDKGAARARVVACTLLPYEAGFTLGESLAEADRPVTLNHPHCAKFCVLGGASCSPN